MSLFETHQLDVYRETLTANTTGGYSRSKALSHSIFARISSRKVITKERSHANKLEAETIYDLYVLPQYDVKRGDELRWQGKSFQVVVKIPVSNESGVHHYRCELSEIQKK